MAWVADAGDVNVIVADDDLVAKLTNAPEAPGPGNTYLVYMDLEPEQLVRAQVGQRVLFVKKLTRKRACKVDVIFSATYAGLYDDPQPGRKRAKKKKHAEQPHRFGWILADLCSSKEATTMEKVAYYWGQQALHPLANSNEHVDVMLLMFQTYRER